MIDAITSKARREFARAHAITIADWRLLAIAVKELAFARFRHASLPTMKIIAGSPGSQAQSLNKKSGALDVARVSWAVGAASRRVPWRADCLVQAMAAKRWLGRHGITTECLIGVDKDAEGALISHAWLMCGDRLITGSGYEGFHVMIGPVERVSPIPDLPDRQQVNLGPGLSV
jgi:Transglutaminase-like superfamily